MPRSDDHEGDQHQAGQRSAEENEEPADGAGPPVFTFAGAGSLPLSLPVENPGAPPPRGEPRD